MKAVFLVLALLLSGCVNTVTPDVIKDSSASWDGMNRNSGILRVAPMLGGFVVTEHFIERYDALVGIYGDSKDSLTKLPYFTPELKKRYGVVRNGDEWIISPAGISCFTKMNQWSKSGRKPQ